MDDFDERLRACAAGPAGEFDAADVARRAGRLRRRRRLVSGLGVAVVLGVIGLGTVSAWDGGDAEVVFDDDGGEAQTFARPEAGEVVAITAPDGQPAFLVGHEDGAKAFHAVEPVGGGMRELVVWCQPAETFFTPFAGSEWTSGGAYLGGPAPGDLVSYQTNLDDEQVVVGPARARPERTRDATAPPGDPFEACRADQGSAGSPTPDTVRSLPTDPDVTVSHAHPQQGEWPPLDQALATADGPDTLDVRLALTGTSGEPLRACSDPTGQPPQCGDNAPVIDDLDPVDDELEAVGWQGYARVTTDGTTITGFDHWVSVTDRSDEPAGQERTTSWQPSRWDGARLEEGRLTLYFTGSAPLEPGDPCTREYEAVIEPTEDTMVVTLRGRPPAPPSPDHACDDIGYERSVTVDLPEPLRGRTVVDGASGEPKTISRAARLLTPSWLPADYEKSSDDVDSDTDSYVDRQVWAREGPADKQLIVEQGGETVEELGTPGRKPVVLERPTIRGRAAAVWKSEGFDDLVCVSWVEDSTGHRVCSSGPSGDLLPTDKLIRVADQLRAQGS